MHLIGIREGLSYKGTILLSQSFKNVLRSKVSICVNMGLVVNLVP